uniref:SWIM-type domain-containing protein n=1 Tax=Helianthus annuus TaxID=4232 RepID=A0A251T446_HELAN
MRHPLTLKFRTKLIRYERNIFLLNDFLSHDDLESWVKRRGLANGYIVVTKRSKDNRVWLQCCCSGEHESKATVRKTGSKKCACPFMVIGCLDRGCMSWRIDYLNKNFNEAHNHGPAEHLEGHAYARRLTPNEFRLVQVLTDQDIQPHTIWNNRTLRTYVFRKTYTTLAKRLGPRSSRKNRLPCSD